MRVEEALLHRAFERRPVEVALAEVLLPRVTVRVELHERHWPVPLCERAKLRQRDRMVAAKCSEEDAALDERRKHLLDLRVRALRVAGRDGDVAVVDDAERLDDVDAEARIEGTNERRCG